jgi:lipoate-protein ligase A
MKWRVLISGKLDPYMNMAIDEAVYYHVTRENTLPLIRFYDWEPASFSCGFNQDIDKELDFQLLKNSPYGFVRRPTGGRLVLHEEEVTYSVISPLDGKMAGSISDTYLRIGKALVKGLKQLEIEVELARGSLTVNEQKRSANPCFTSSSRFELTYKRKKIVGSAQTRNNRAFLQHGSILKSCNQKRVADFIPGLTEDERLRIASLLERRTISIESILEHPVTFEEAVEQLLWGFKNEWLEDEFQIIENLAPEEEEYARTLALNKYSTDNWNRNLKKKSKRI